MTTPNNFKHAAAFSLRSSQHLSVLLAHPSQRFSHAPMATNRLLLIGGKLVFAEGRKVAEVINPATGAAFASVPEASREDLHLAVRAAKEAFKSWKKTSFQERANCLVSFGG